ncbi:SAM-dependent methyltransferase, partial [Candidatus Peregrinibacteria bacterium]|nr:SAM-dependent methyltransferase [Candidatus Peregrinibacteria bacterium]
IQGIGYEIAPLVYILAMIKKFLNHSKTQILWKNFFASNLSGADIIFCYLMPNMLEKVGKKMIKECDKGTLIVSHTFQIKGLKPFKIWARHQDLPEIYLYKL